MNIDQTLFSKVRKIQIKTSRMVTEMFSGEYRSVFKGRGMEFEEVREYQPGDEIRSIDWNVTARMNRPFVKQFTEERELTVFFLVDTSSSMNFGSKDRSKKELVAELCAVLAFTAIQNKDKVGVILFSDAIEKYIPPKKGKRHVLRVIRELLATGTDSLEDRKGTDLKEALEYFGKVQNKRAVCFVVSDFFTENYLRVLNILTRKHDMVAIHVSDPLEKNLPSTGILTLKDLETGKLLVLDLSSPETKNRFRSLAEERMKSLQEQFRSKGMDLLFVETGKDYLKTLTLFFRGREKRKKR